MSNLRKFQRIFNYMRFFKLRVGTLEIKTSLMYKLALKSFAHQRQCSQVFLLNAILSTQIET